MTLFLRVGLCAVLASSLACGCRTPQPANSGPARPSQADRRRRLLLRRRRPAARRPIGRRWSSRLPVVPADGNRSVASGGSRAADCRCSRLDLARTCRRPRADDGLFAGRSELVLAELVALVEARNASLEAMTYAWRAATQRYPQAIALDDPVFMGMMAPASFNSSTVSSAYHAGRIAKAALVRQASAARSGGSVRRQRHVSRRRDRQARTGSDHAAGILRILLAEPRTGIEPAARVADAGVSPDGAA